jgi:hypothetical protein
MKRLSCIIAVALLAGCNVHSKSGDDDKVNINADASGQIAFDVPLHNGNFDIDGVKLMPGSQVTGFSLDAHDKASVVNMSFTAPASPDAVRAYFLDQFRKKGRDVAVAGDSVTGKSKDGSPFTIQVSPAGSGSNGMIRIEDKD